MTTIGRMIAHAARIRRQARPKVAIVMFIYGEEIELWS